MLPAFPEVAVFFGQGQLIVDMINELHTRLITSCIPDSQLMFINGNHFIANKKPEEFNRAVLDFMSA